MNQFVVHATAATFDTLIQTAATPVIVDFWAPWCQPCIWMSPVLDTVAEERRDTLMVVKVNVDDAPDLARRFGIQSIPTTLRFDDGKETRRVVGTLSKDRLITRMGLGA